MMSTATLPRIHELPPAERQAAYDMAAARVMECQRELSAAHKARKPDPRSIHDYRGYRTMGLVCVLVVKHQPKPASIECSRDGSAYPRIYLPTSKSILQPETTDDFALICLPKWLARKAELTGVTPELCEARPWTDAQRETWDALRKLHLSINGKIYFANRRSSSGSRGAYA
jgi:hypothetical protein